MDLASYAKRLIDVIESNSTNSIINKAHIDDLKWVINHPNKNQMTKLLMTLEFLWYYESRYNHIYRTETDPSIRSDAATKLVQLTGIKREILIEGQYYFDENIKRDKQLNTN